MEQKLLYYNVATPFWSKCEDETHTSKSGNLESFRTPKHSELDCRGQNTLHWGVLYTVGKVLKYRCSKWPHMSHLDICSTSYGRKKGRESKLTIWFSTTKSWESTWPRCVHVECDTPLKSSSGELQVCFRLHPNRRSKLGVMSFQSPGSPNQDNFETPFWESRDKTPFGCRSRGQTHRILYARRWWLPPSPGHGESSESMLPVACPFTKHDPECGLTNL
jgi:hypothetical protein